MSSDQVPNLGFLVDYLEITVRQSPQNSIGKRFYMITASRLREK